MNQDQATLSSFHPAELVLLAQASSPASQAAAQRLLETHTPLVLKATKAFRFGDDSDEDVLQSGRLAMLELIPGFDLSRGTSFGAYARWYVVAAAREARAGGRKPTDKSIDKPAVQLKLQAKGLLAVEDPDLQAAEAGHDRPVMLSAVHQFVASLPDRQRQAVELVFWRGLSQAEAARQLGISPPAVGKLLAKVYEKGRVSLSAYAPS